MEAGSNVFEQIALWSQVFGAIAFLIVLILAFRRFLMPAVRANQLARNAEIRAAEQRREQIRAECARANAEVEAADRDATEIRGRVGDVSRREHDAALAAAKDEGERMVRNAEGELARARNVARDRLRIEFIEKALAKARAEAGSRVDAATNARLVGATIDDLTGGKA